MPRPLSFSTGRAQRVFSAHSFFKSIFFFDNIRRKDKKESPSTAFSQPRGYHCSSLGSIILPNPLFRIRCAFASFRFLFSNTHFSIFKKTLFYVPSRKEAFLWPIRKPRFTQLFRAPSDDRLLLNPLDRPPFLALLYHIFLRF